MLKEHDEQAQILKSLEKQADTCVRQREILKQCSNRTDKDLKKQEFAVKAGENRQKRIETETSAWTSAVQQKMHVSARSNMGCCRGKRDDQRMKYKTGILFVIASNYKLN